MARDDLRDEGAAQRSEDQGRDDCVADRDHRRALSLRGAPRVFCASRRCTFVA